FLWPFVKMIMMIAIVVGLTFAVLKIANSAYTVQTTIAKYGAYLIPFGLLLAAGILLLLMGLGAVGVVAIIVSLFGTLFFIPMFVTMENKLSGIDRIYLLVLLHIVNCFVFAFVLRSLFAPFILGLDDILFISSRYPAIIDVTWRCWCCSHYRQFVRHSFLYPYVCDDGK